MIGQLADYYYPPITAGSRLETGNGRHSIITAGSSYEPATIAVL
jgi:hypothetical protein